MSLCDEISQLLLNPNYDNPMKTDNLVLINMIQELLLFAKLQFLKSDNGGKDNEGVNVCDSFLSHVELLQSLLISKSLPVGFTFRDFSIPQRAR